MKDNELYIGAGATIHHWSDRTAATVIQIFQNGKKIILQEDLAIRTDSNGMSESQSYDYQRDPTGSVYVATLRKDGRYRITKSTQVVSIGTRNKYHDYSF